MSEEKKEVAVKKEESAFKKFLKALPWRVICYSAYQGIRSLLVKKIEDSKSKVDDGVLQACDYLIDKFVKPEDEKAE